MWHSKFRQSSKGDYQPIRYLVARLISTEHKHKFPPACGAHRTPLVITCKAFTMKRNGLIVVSLLVALLHPNGGEGMNINTYINVPVTVIHSN